MNAVPTPKPITIKAAAGRAVLKAAVLLALATVGFIFMAHVAQTQNAGLGDQPNYGRVTAKGSPQDLIAKHDCWTGGQAAKGLPTAAVLSLRTQAAPVYTTNPALVSAAFDAAVGEADLPHRIYTVHAFCAA